MQMQFIFLSFWHSPRSFYIRSSYLFSSSHIRNSTATSTAFARICSKLNLHSIYCETILKNIASISLFLTYTSCWSWNVLILIQTLLLFYIITLDTCHEHDRSHFNNCNLFFELHCMVEEKDLTDCRYLSSLQPINLCHYPVPLPLLAISVCPPTNNRNTSKKILATKL